MIPAIVQSPAIDDIDGIARHIDGIARPLAVNDLGAGLRFYDAIAETCDLLGRYRWPAPDVCRSTDNSSGSGHTA